jgi:hypothetical protein
VRICSSRNKRAWVQIVSPIAGNALLLEEQTAGFKAALAKADFVLFLEEQTLLSADA